MKTKKLLSLLLVIALVLSMGSISVFAEPAEAATADVYIATQLGGGFLSSPLTPDEVSSDLSEKYGFTDDVDGVSVLDALIKEHEIVFGDSFTAATAGDYLVMSDYGTPSKAFGIDGTEYYSGFMLNEGYPNDGTEYSPGQYNGTVHTNQEIKSGDKVDFFFYEDPYYGDTYTWIDGDLSALPGEDATVTVTGHFVMAGSNYKTPEDFKDAASEIEGASLAWVSENGTLSEIEDVYTDEVGEATISIPSDMEPGTYYLTVLQESDDYMFLCLMNPTPFVVANELSAYVTISQNADFVQTKDGDVFNRLPVTLSDKAEYTIDDVLSAAHEEYADADHGYESGMSAYGLAITKLWGDTSGAFGYYQNDNSAWSLADKVSDGDFISAFVYKDTTYWTDAYTKFEEETVSAPAGEEATFTLLKYDWGTYSFIPCEGATLSVLENDTIEAVTNENGKATLVFPAEGEYTVVAKDTDAPIVPTSVKAEISAPLAEAVTANVYIVAQSGGEFLSSPLSTYAVSNHLSDKYGFTDEVDGVSVLDALIKLHEDKFGEAFTKETAANYLSANGGYISEVFGISTYSCGFMLNEGYPNDGTESTHGGYNGTTVTTQEIADGDKLDFYIYQDTTYYSDNYSWIEGDLSALPGEDAELTASGSMVMLGYLYKTPEDFKDSAEPLEGVQLAWVDKDGNITEIEDAVTDEDGVVIISVPDDMAAGTYYLTVTGTDDYDTPVIMNPTPFVVATELSAYVTISQNADFVKTKDGDVFNRLPVTLSDKAEYTIDDVLSAAHEEYADADHGYESGMGAYGLAITKLWGDTSGAFGYYQNDNSAWSLTDKVSDGDFISAFVYKDTTYWTDAYTKFEEETVSAPAGEAAEFTLLKYDWGTYSFIPCEGATLSVLENDTIEAVTDENGKATLVFPAEGEYTVVAKDTDAPIVPTSVKAEISAPVAVGGLTLQETAEVYENATVKLTYTVEPENAFDKSVSWKSSAESVATVSDGVVRGIKAGSAEITATTNDGKFSKKCTVTVKEVPAELAVLHGIAAKYAESGIANDANAPWFAADMATYKYLFPETENYLSDEQIREYLDKLIPEAEAAEKPGDLAKYIIALRALGFDPTDVVSAERVHTNLVQKLAELIEFGDAGVTNIYTLPYVIIAMNEDEEYLSEENMDKLISSALQQKTAWQNNTWGVDTAAAMAVALAPFADDENVKAVLDETAEILKGAQADDGSFGNASSTGLALAALSSLGIDGCDVKKDGASVLGGLMTQAADTLDGFLPLSNSFGTEQGMRGLLAHQLLEQNTGKALYDFSGNPKNAAEATWAENCPVTFSVVPDGAEITVSGNYWKDNNKYDMPAGTYTYTASKSGYKRKTGTFEITNEEAENHTPKTVYVSLQSIGTTDSPSREVTVNVLTHDKNKCDGAYTYYKNKSAYKKIASGTVKIHNAQTVFDALDKILTENDIDYVEKTRGYISSIGEDSEFDHGPNSGWLFMVDGVLATKGCRDTYVKEGSTITWFYTDDYTGEQGSEKWSKGSAGTSGGASLSNACKVTFETNGGDNYPVLEVDKGGKMSYVADPERKGYIFQGWFTDKELTKAFDINEPITNNITLYAKWEKDPDVKEIKLYNDVSKDDWFYDAAAYCYRYGLMIGTGDNFEPDTEMTRAMLVTVLYRLDGQYEKAADCKFADVTADDWYFDSVAWGEENGIVLGISDTEFAPDELVTREQTALIFERYAKFKNCFTENYSDLSEFEDKDEISSWATEGVSWAVGEGIITGITATLISPKTSATRAQAAVLLMRFFNLVK